LELKNGELISGGDDSSLRRWRNWKPLANGKPITTKQDGVRSLLELNNGELISLGGDGSLRRWHAGDQVGDGKPITTGQVAIFDLVQLRNGWIVTGGYDGSLMIIDAKLAIKAGCLSLKDNPGIAKSQAPELLAARKTCKQLNPP
jgi:hypothetical protein